MCGRYAFFAPPKALKDLLGLDNMLELVPRYNSAPMQDLPIVIKNRIGLARWGFADRYINARSETVAEKTAFRDAWMRGHRCLVPASGWYEWQGGRKPFFIHAQQEEILLFAGVWERAAGGVRFAILTHAADGALGGLHPRMPVIVPSTQAPAWFDGHDLAPMTTDLSFHPVSPEVGQVANDDVSLTEEWAADKAPFRLVSCMSS